jgi:4-hydroxy-2-oxoheptanedioate aldolase
VPYLHSHAILHALDSGALGVHIPNVNTVVDAKSAVSFCKYVLVGSRGLAGVRAADYGLKGRLSDYCQTANAETMVIVHIEDIEAIHNLEALLNVEGIDVYYLGPTDLSNSMGKPGVTDSELQTVVDNAIGKIVGAGKTAGIITTDPQAARRYVGMGVRYLATHPVQFMAAGSRAFLQALRG